MRSLGRLLLEARELSGWYVAIVVGSILSASAALLTPFIIKWATDEVVAQAQGGGRGVGALLWLAAALLATELFAAVIGNVSGYLGDTMTARLRAILSSRYYSRILGLPQRWFDSELTGTVINRLQRSISETTQFLQTFANTFFPMLLTLVAALVVTGLYSWPLALLLVSIYPLFGWLTALTSKRWQVIEGEKNLRYDVAGGRFAEVVGQIRVVKSFVQEWRELTHFNNHYRETVALTGAQSRYWHLMDTLRRGALAVIFFGIHAIIFVNTAQGTFSIGVMVLLIQLITMAKGPASGMSYLVDSAQRAIAGSRDYLKVMVELSEPHATIPTPLSIDLAAGHQEVPAVAPAPAITVAGGEPMIRFEDVHFGYTAGREVLHGVTCDVRPGERVAFVGESGGGKTTLVNLLLGLYRPDSGRILIGGSDTSDWPLSDVRRMTTVVFQDAQLFSGTVFENITYAVPDADEAAAIEAARSAHVHSFVQGLPDGYASEIGERGIKLSGGQKQRVAVARAMVKEAPILVLDEATSALDTKSERLVQAGLERLMRQRTSLIIAHRLSTISSVDRIITLADGRVDEIGTPAELAASGGIYAELLALQGSASKADRKRLQEFDITG